MLLYYFLKILYQLSRCHIPSPLNYFRPRKYFCLFVISVIRSVLFPIIILLLPLSIACLLHDLFLFISPISYPFSPIYFIFLSSFSESPRRLPGGPRGLRWTCAAAISPPSLLFFFHFIKTSLSLFRVPLSQITISCPKLLIFVSKSSSNLVFEL